MPLYRRRRRQKKDIFFALLLLITLLWLMGFQLHPEKLLELVPGSPRNPRTHLLTFRKEDNLFSDLLTQTSLRPKKDTAMAGLPEIAARAAGVKNITPEQMQKYAAKAREQGLSV